MLDRLNSNFTSLENFSLNPDLKISITSTTDLIQNCLQRKISWSTRDRQSRQILRVGNMAAITFERSKFTECPKTGKFDVCS